MECFPRNILHLAPNIHGFADHRVRLAHLCRRNKFQDSTALWSLVVHRNQDLHTVPGSKNQTMAGHGKEGTIVSGSPTNIEDGLLPFASAQTCEEGTLNLGDGESSSASWIMRRRPVGRSSDSRQSHAPSSIAANRAVPPSLLHADHGEGASCVYRLREAPRSARARRKQMEEEEEDAAPCRNNPHAKIERGRGAAEAESSSLVAATQKAPQEEEEEEEEVMVKGAEVRLESAGGGLWFAALYCVASISLQVTNKTLFASWGVPAVFAISLSQAIAAVSVLSLCSVFDVYRMPPLDLPTLLRMAPLAFFALATAVSGMIGLRLLSLPAYLSVRRLATPTALLCEWAVWGRVPSTPSVAALAMLTLGSVVAFASDSTLSLAGLAATMAANLATVASSFVVKTAANRNKASVIDLLFYNSLIGAPFLLFLTVASGELPLISAFPRLCHASFHAELAATIALALLYQLSLFACTARNTPLVTSVSGSIKDMATSLVGMCIAPAMPSPINLGGLVVSLAGACCFVALQ